MKKQVFVNFILLFLILFLFLFILTGCTSEKESLRSKTEEEIKYVEEKIIAMMNRLNQINFSNSVLIEEKIENKKQSESDSSQEDNKKQSSNSGGNSKQEGKSGGSDSSGSSNNSQNSQNTSSEQTTQYEIVNDNILGNSNKKIDWENIKSNTESMHDTWATLTIDLHSLNVNNEDILNFGDVLNQVTLDVKEEDKTSTMNNLANLYAFLPNYRKQISDDNEKINIDYTKACILNTYALSEQEKWDDMKNQAANAIQYISNIMNSVSKNIQNQNKISKVYVLLNELNNSIDLRDKDLYMIKYRNVMEELVNL